MPRIVNGQYREDGKSEERVIITDGGVYNEAVYGNQINIDGRDLSAGKRVDLSKDGKPPIDVKAK